MKWFKKKQVIKSTENEYRIPAELSGITLAQFCLYKKALTDVDRVCVILNERKANVEKIELKSIAKIIELFEGVLRNGTVKHFKKINVGKRLGFIPDIENISYKEFADIDTLTQKAFNKANEVVDVDAFVKLMAIFYRPITEEVGDYYRIEEYDTINNRPKYIGVLRNMTMDVVFGTLLFFSALENDLWHSGLESLKQINKEMTAELLKRSDKNQQQKG